MTASKEVGVDWLEPTGFGTPSDFTAFQILEDTPTVHHVIVCALCSCYPRPILGNSPEWYRTPNYRRRFVRWPRQVLAEFGLYLPDDIAVRVEDSNQKHRFMVMPMRPEGTDGLDRGPAGGDHHPRLPDRCRPAEGRCHHQRRSPTPVRRSIREDRAEATDEHYRRVAIGSTGSRSRRCRDRRSQSGLAGHGREVRRRESRAAVEDSLDGFCDALDHAACDADVPNFKERRDEEDALSATVYSSLPYPENQLVALAHSLVARGVIDEAELQERLSAIRARLEA